MGYELGQPDGDTRRLSRRSLLRGAAGLGALTALSGILAACGQQAQPAAPQKPAEPAAAAKPTDAPKPAAPAAAQPTAAAGAPTAAAPAAAVELRFAWWGSQDRHDRTIKAIQLYQQKNPGVTINYEFAGFQDHLTKMTTQATGGNLPDLMQQDYAWISQWVGNKLPYSFR